LDEEPIVKGLNALQAFTRGLSPSIRKPAHETVDESVLQSCVSPIWDTALAALGLLESGVSPQDERLQKTRDYLWAARVERKSDWSYKAKLKRGTETAAWCFQYEN